MHYVCSYSIYSYLVDDILKQRSRETEKNLIFLKMVAENKEKELRAFLVSTVPNNSL